MPSSVHGCVVIIRGEKPWLQYTEVPPCSENTSAVLRKRLTNIHPSIRRNFYIFVILIWSRIRWTNKILTRFKATSNIVRSLYYYLPPAVEFYSLQFIPPQIYINECHKNLQITETAFFLRKPTVSQILTNEYLHLFSKCQPTSAKNENHCNWYRKSLYIAIFFWYKKGFNIYKSKEYLLFYNSANLYQLQKITTAILCVPSLSIFNYARSTEELD